MWFKYGFRYREEIATLEFSSATTINGMWTRSGWGHRSTEHLMRSTTLGQRTINEQQHELAYGSILEDVPDDWRELDDDERILWNVTTGFFRTLFSHVVLHTSRTKASECDRLSYTTLLANSRPYGYARYASQPRYTPFDRVLPPYNVGEYIGLFLDSTYNTLSVNHSTMSGLDVIMQDDADAVWFADLKFFRVVHVGDFYRYSYVTFEVPYVDVQIVGYNSL